MRLNYFDANGYIHTRSRRLSVSGSKEKGKKEIEKIKENTLIHQYLCKGKKSPCVKSHACDMLDSCLYGQRYLEIMENQNEK